LRSNDAGSKYAEIAKNRLMKNAPFTTVNRSSGSQRAVPSTYHQSGGPYGCAV
jgi:hypothetical protein